LIEGNEEQPEQDGSEDFELRALAQAEGRIVRDAWGGPAVFDGKGFHET
jgi:hypothetical protein